MRLSSRRIALGLGLMLAAVAVPAAEAQQIAVFGNNDIDDLINLIPGYTATLVSDAQLATPGFLAGFAALVYTRDGSSGGSGLSFAAAQNVRSYVGSSGRYVLLNADFADGATDPTNARLIANAVVWAAASGHGFLGEYSGSVAAVSSNANGFEPLDLVPGSAGPLGSGNGGSAGTLFLAPGQLGHPVLQGLPLFFDPQATEFGADLTGAPVADVLANFGIGGNAGVLAGTANTAVDLVVNITDTTPDPAIAGSGANNVVHTVTLQSRGPIATNLEIESRIIVPAGASLGTVTASAGTISLAAVPAGTGIRFHVFWTFPSFGPSQTATLTIPVTAGPAAEHGAIVDHDTEVNVLDQRLRNVGDDTDAENTLIQRRATLSLTKTDSPDPVVPAATSQPLTYTVLLGNSGPSDAGDLALTDTMTLPAGVTVQSITASGGTTFSGSAWTVPVVPAGGSRTLVFTLAVDSSTATGTDVVSNSIALTTVPSYVTNPSLSATQGTSVLRLVDLAVSAVESADPVIAGSGPQNLTYTLTLSNAGPSVATGVKISSALTLPSGVTLDAAVPSGSTTFAGSIWDVGTLAVGGTASLSLVMTAGASAPGGSSSIVDAVGVAAINETRTNLGNDSATLGTSIVRNPDLAITKTDLVDPVSAGSTVAYLITVTNNGPSDATGVTVTDTLPATLTLNAATPSAGICAPAGSTVTCLLGGMARAASASIVLDATVASTASGTISNTASAIVTGGDVDPTTPNQGTAFTTVLGQADLALTKADAPDPVIAGNTLTYTLTATNLGPGTATGVVLSDSLPAGLAFASAVPATLGCTFSAGTLTCNLGTLAPGASVPVTVTTTVSASTSGTLTNTATLLGNQPDPAPSNNAATASTTVGPPFDLSVAMSDMPDPVAVGGNLLLSLTATNHGPSTATGVELVMSYHLGLTINSAVPAQGSCSWASGVLLCSLGTLASGTSVAVTVQATAGASAVGTIQTTAGVAGQGVDSNPANDGALVQSTVQAVADLAVTLTDSPDPIGVGGTLVYTATVTNGGPATASGVSLSLPLPAGLTALAAQAGQGSCAIQAGTVTCDLQSLVDGASVVVQVQGQVGSTAPASLSVTATVSAAGIDPAAANNSATATTGVSLLADLSLTASDVPDPVAAGETLTYELAVANAGPAQATGVVLTVGLPAGLQLTAARASEEEDAGDGPLLDEREPDVSQRDEPWQDSAMPGLRGSVLIFADGFESGDFSAWSQVVGGPPQGPPGCSQAGATVTCSLGTIAASATAHLDLELAVPPSASGTLNASATVTSAVSDPQGGNDAASLATSVSRFADLALSVAASPGTVPPGGIVTYTWTIDNGGPTTATGIDFSDPLPPELVLISALPSQGSCGAVSPVACQLGTLTAGAQATVVVRAQVAGGAGGSLTNTASVEAEESDLDLVNNTATAITGITGSAGAAVGGPSRPALGSRAQAGREDQRER